MVKIFFLYDRCSPQLGAHTERNRDRVFFHNSSHFS
jgi:hypothetical protein